MTSQDIAVVAFFVSALIVFGGALGWASWREWRDTRHPRKSHK